MRLRGVCPWIDSASGVVGGCDPGASIGVLQLHSMVAVHVVGRPRGNGASGGPRGGYLGARLSALSATSRSQSERGLPEAAAARPQGQQHHLRVDEDPRHQGRLGEAARVRPLRGLAHAAAVRPLEDPRVPAMKHVDRAAGSGAECVTRVPLRHHDARVAEQVFHVAQARPRRTRRTAHMCQRSWTRRCPRPARRLASPRLAASSLAARR